jgi:hypothetical protein
MKLKLQQVGTDSELFAVDPEGMCIPAPLFHDEGKGQAPIHWDNACLEVAMPPADTEDRFVDVVQQWKRLVEYAITKHNLTPSWVPHTWIPEDYLNDSRVKHAGCDPDFNVYTGTRNPRPKLNSPLRVAGGHVHISYDGPKDPATHRMIVTGFESLHGTVGVLHDPSAIRSTLYGKAGSYRPKPYGLELRSPSTWWLKSEDTIRFTFRAARMAVEQPDELTKMYSTTDILRRTLDDRDQAVALGILTAFNQEYPTP